MQKRDQWREIAFELSEDIQALLGPDFVILDCNDRCAAVLGGVRDEIVGRRLDHLLGENRFRALLGSHLSKGLTGEQVRFELWLDLPGTGRTRLRIGCAPVDMGGDMGGEVAVALVAKDVSRLRAMEDEVRHSRRLLADVVESAPAAMFLVAAGSGRILSWNRQAQDLFGLRVEAVVGRTLDEAFGRDTAVLLRELDQRAMSERTPVITRDQSLNLWGMELHVDMVRVCMPDEEGSPRFVLCMARDRTREQEFASALYKRVEYQKALALCARNLLAGSGGNDALANALELLLKAVDGNRVYIFENFEDARDGLCCRHLTSVCEGGECVGFPDPLMPHTAYARQLPRWRDELSMGRILHGPAKSFPEAERQMIEAQGVCSVLVLPVQVMGRWWGFMGVDDVRTARRWGKEEIEMLQIAAEIVGAHLERAGVESELRQARDGLESQVSRRTKQLESTNVQLRAEIRERTIMEQELVRARDKARLASEAKDVFLGNMSHELRTPLNGVLGMGQLLMGTKLTPEQKELMTISLRSTRSLLRTVNDLLELSAISRDAFALQEECFRLDDLLGPVVRGFAEEADSRGLTLDCVVDPEVPTRFMGDVLRVQQVFVNLLSNACKFTEKGGITIRVSPCGPDWNNGQGLCFAVHDTGLGIAPDKLEVIFDQFSLAEDYLTKRYGGSGLGLAISRKIVEGMGGRIWAESKLGRGSVFHFQLPLASPDAPVQSPASVQQTEMLDQINEHSSGRILLAEDELISRMVALRALESKGYTVDVAINGEEALEKLAKSSFDLVLMDIQMPRINGLDATRSLRAGEVDGADSNVPVVAMTAFASHQDRERSREVGMDAYLVKPIEIDGLLVCIEKVLSRRQALEQGLSQDALGYPHDASFLNIDN